MSEKVHDFHEDFGWSQRRTDDERIEAIWREYFANPPDFEVDWGPRKRAFGADGTVQAWGKVYTFDDKRRRRDYSDELLEEWSNDRTRRRGWTWNCGKYDYVLHLYHTRFEIFPGPALQKAFRENLPAWSEQFERKYARNPRYTTVNLQVKTRDLKWALARCGAPICPHCSRNVGKFHVSCAGCGFKSCCVVTDGEWFCAGCER